jgi:gas vesicle protein
MSDRSWDRFSGLLIGAAIGFVAGVLLAPESGESTRETIKRRTQNSVAQLRGNAEEIRQNLRQRGKSILHSGVTEIEIREQDPVIDSGSPDA